MSQKKNVKFFCPSFIWNFHYIRKENAKSDAWGLKMQH